MNEIDKVSSVVQTHPEFFSDREGEYPNWDAIAKSVIQAIRESDEAAGMVTVPREPTEAMMDAPPLYFGPGGDLNHRYAVTVVWQAMLAAYKPEPKP